MALAWDSASMSSVTVLMPWLRVTSTSEALVEPTPVTRRCTRG